MYNASQIEAFIMMVHKEANEAAQKVYNKYQPELERRILAQLKSGNKFTIGMGTATIENKEGEYIAEELADVLARTQYCEELDANFILNDMQKP